MAGTTGEVLGTLLDATTSYSLSTENQEFFYDLGAVGQTCDDLLDRDEPFARSDIKEIQQEYLRRIYQQKPFMRILAEPVVRGYSGFANVARKLEQFLDREPNSTSVSVSSTLDGD